MRAIGIVSDLGMPPGLYARRGVPEEATLPLWNRYLQLGDALSSGEAVRAIGATGLLFAAGGVFVGTAVAAYLLYRHLTGVDLAPIERIEHARLPDPNHSSSILPSEAILIPAAGLGGEFADFDSPVFHGLFPDRGAMRSLMDHEGGHSELLIVDQRTAHKLFRRAGGGRFARGLYLPHLKDGELLVPREAYSDFLRDELIAEWVQICEALGASRVIIADSTNVSVKASASVGTVAGEVGGEMRATYGSSNVEESVYAAGTFDPGRALSHRRWLGDHPAILAIVEGRIEGRQQSWRRTVKVDASFGASASFLSFATATKGKAGGFCQLRADL